MENTTPHANLDFETEGQLHNLVSFHYNMSTVMLPHYRTSDIFMDGQCSCPHGRGRKKNPWLIKLWVQGCILTQAMAFRELILSLPLFQLHKNYPS